MPEMSDVSQLPDGPRDSRPSRDPEDSLRVTHRALLVWLVVCGLAIATQLGGDDAPPPPRATTAALVLAVVTVLTRRIGSSPVVGATARRAFITVSYACASTIAGLGLYLAFQAGGAQTGLLFTLGAFIFCVVPPRRAAPPGTPGVRVDGRSQTERGPGDRGPL